MRLYSFVGALKATESPLTIPNLQDIMFEGPHFDPTSFIEVGKQLEHIRDGFKVLAYTLKEQAATSLPETPPLPRASKSKSTTLFWRHKHTPSQTPLGSSSTPSIIRSISTIVGFSTDSSEDETTLSPQGSPTPTTSSSSS
ncbi:MAG: hypothetical protein F9K49_07710 [Caedimonadaceae bacterium]|nr:MAG: hypothetical protein F9K49_07710 [Caedimonadaceae bacterium]